MIGKKCRIFAVIAAIVLLLSSILILDIQLEKETTGGQIEYQSDITSKLPARRSTRAGTDWPMHLQNPLHTSFTPDSGPITDEVLWDNWTGGPSGQTYGSPSLAYDKVFIGGGSGMNAFWASNGTLAWRTNIGTISGGTGLSSTPALDNGYVFFGGNNTIYCLWENNGTIKWMNPTAVGGTWGDGTPTVANGRVYIGGRDWKLYAIQQETGIVDWTFQTSSSGGSNFGLYAAPAISNGFVYLAGADGNLYKINETQPTSTATADYVFSMAYASYSSPVVVNGRVFVGCGYTSPATNNRFYALDATDLSLIWEFYPGTSVTFFSSAGIYNDKVYIGSLGQNLYCLDVYGFENGNDGWTGESSTNLGDGDVIWYYNIGGTWSSPALTDDKLYIGSKNNFVYCFNLSQSMVPEYYWIFDTNGDVDSSPAVVDGKVYIASQGNNGRLFCFGNQSPAPAIDRIEIESSPNHLGSPIANQPLEVGVQITGYAAAYNDSSGYMYDVPVNWSFINLGSANASTNPLLSSSSSTLYSGFFGGSVQWTADDAEGHSDTVTFTILEPGIDSIRIVDSRDTGLTEIPSAMVDVGYSILGYAAGFNDTIDYVKDVSVTWSVINTSAEGETTPTTGTNSTLDVGLSGGTVQWIADDLSGHVDSVTFTVNDPNIDYIVIRTGPNGTGTWVGDSTFIFGDIATFYAAGYNATANWIMDVPANWSSDDTFTGDVIFGPSESTLFTALDNGTCKVTAEYNTLTNTTGVLSVINYTVDYIIIRDSPNGMGNPVGDIEFSVGESSMFHAAGYNDSVGFIGNVAVTWESSNTSIGTVTTPGQSTTFSSQSDAGNCIVTARYGAVITDVTGLLSVVTAALDYIVITDSPDGVELTTVSLNVGEKVTVYASGYNTTTLYLGLVEVDWSQSPLSLGTLSIPTGTSSVFTAGNLGGSTAISGANTSLGLNDEFTMVVNDPTVDYMQIRDAADGLGNIVTTRIYSVNEIDEFYAAAYNFTVNYLHDIEVAWSSDDTTTGSVTSPGINTTVVARRIDTNKVFHVTANLTQDISNSTGALTVLAPTLDYFQIVDTNNNQVTTIIYDIDDWVILHALGFNNTVGSIGYVQVSWSAWPNIINISANFATTTNVSAIENGTTTLRVESGPILEETVTITVRDPISAPEGLEVFHVDGGGALNLSWNESTEDNFAGYYIFRSFSPGGEFTRITQELLTSPLYTDTSLANGVRHFYYVVAIDSKGRMSEPSIIANGIPDIDTDGDGKLDHEDLDKDGDGLSDFEEIKLGTDTLLVDTDGDGYSDLEDAYPLDPKKWEEAPSEGFPLVILLIIVIIIVVVLLLFLLTKKDKKEETPPPAEEKKELPPPPSRLKEKKEEQEIDEEYPPLPDDGEEEARPDEDGDMGSTEGNVSGKMDAGKDPQPVDEKEPEPEDEREPEPAEDAETDEFNEDDLPPPED